MLEIINTWLANPSGRYSDGIAIFEQLAPEEIKKRYLIFFKEVESPKQHDQHFSILINKVAAIAQKVRSNPAAFENIQLVLKKTTSPDAATLALIEEKNALISDLKSQLANIKIVNLDIISENEDLSGAVETLESDLEDADSNADELQEEINVLESEIERLKALRGIQIVAFKDLPEDLRVMFDRNREITPIMANLHAQMSVEGLNGNTRKSIVKKLTTLDDERRANWDAINDWAEGKTLADSEVHIEVPEYSADPLVAGVQIARRIERLKENISRSIVSLETSDKETIKENAQKRIEAYEAELAELEAKIKEAV